MSLTLSGMIIGLIVDVLIAARLGTTRNADALIMALSLPLFIDTVTREGTKFSMVPFFIEKMKSLAEAEYQRFVSGFLNLILVGGVFLVAIIESFSPLIISILAPGFSDESRKQTIGLLRLCAPIVFFAIGITLLSVLLTSQKRFSLVALRNTVVPCVVLVTIGAAWKLEDLPLWIAMAYTIGFMTYFIILFVAVKKAGYVHIWSVWMSMRELRNVFGTVSLPTAGFVIRQSSRIVERMIASLVAVGGVSAYYFAFRIFSSIQSIIGNSIAMTGLPQMSESILAGEKGSVIRKLQRNVVWATGLILPVVLVLWGFHDEIIRLIYGRGQFGEDSIQMTSRILLWLGFGLAFFCLIPVLQSALYAQKKYLLVFLNMTLMAAMNISTAWLFSQWWALSGIAISVSLTALLSVLSLLYLLSRTQINLLQLRKGASAWK